MKDCHPLLTSPLSLAQSRAGAVIFALVLNGCAASTSGPPSLSSQLDEEVRHAPRTAFDQSVTRKSSALHSYLLGEMALQGRDSQGAISHFASAKNLFDGPVPTLHIKLAELYLSSGAIEKSLVEVTAALEEEPGNQEYLFLRASLLHALGRIPEAEAAYRSLLNLTSPPFEARLLLGVLLIEDSRSAEARTILKAAVAERPRDGMAHYFYARASEKSGDLADAIRAYEATLDIEPRNPYALIDLTRLMAREGQLSKIKERCERALRSDATLQTAQRILLLISKVPDQTELQAALAALDSTPLSLEETQFRLALAAVRQQEYETALRYLRLLLAKDPSNAEARYNLAAVLSSTGNVSEAAQELWKVDRSSPLFVKSRTFAAFLLRQMKDYVGAERAAREALSNGEADPQILSFLVIILKDAKRLEEARALLEEQLERTPDDERLLFSYGSLLHDLGKDDESLAAMERVIALNPSNSDALNFVAFALAEKNEDLDRASDLIESALKVRPNDGFYLDTQGCILLRQGRHADAEAMLSRAVQLTGEDPEILEHYADALVRTGKREDAISVYRRALEKLRDSDGDHYREAISRVEQKLEKLSPES